MSCRSRWSGPKPDTDMEALLRASIDLAEDRKDKKWSIGFPVVGRTRGEDWPAAGRMAAAEIPSAPPLPPPPLPFPSGPIAEMLSPSQVNGYIDCSARWHYKYVRGLPAPSTGKQVRGRAVHALAAFFFRSRMAGLTPESDVLMEAYNEIWDVESADAVFSAKESPAELHRSGAQLASMYIHGAGGTITPAATEMAVEGVIGGVKVRGRVDLMCRDERGTIIDLKTTGRTPSRVSAGNALQLATYARLTPDATGLVQLDSLVTTKTPKLVSLAYQVSDADIKLTETIYPSTQDSMRRGIYLPNRGSFFCSKANCPFTEACVQEFGGL